MTGAALLQTGAAAALAGAFFWLAGVLLARVWLARSAPQFHQQIGPGLRSGAIAAGALCVAALGASLWAAAAIMGDTGLAEAADMLVPVLTGTAYGHAGLAAMAAAAILAAAQASGGRYAAAIGAAAMLGFALARASISHAGEHGMASVPYAIEVIHLLLVAVWLGGVWLAAWQIVPAARAAKVALPAYLSTLSAWASAALAGIIVTGVWNACQRIESLEQLVDNNYGTALCIKLCLFSIAVFLGGYNRLIGFPLAPRDGAARAVLVLRVESVILTGSVLVAAYLSVQPPPG